MTAIDFLNLIRGLLIAAKISIVALIVIAIILIVDAIREKKAR